MAPVKRRGCCERGHRWRRKPDEDEIKEALDEGRSSTLLIFQVIVKFLASITACCLVLFGCVVAKATLLLMVANMIPAPDGTKDGLGDRTQNMTNDKGATIPMISTTISAAATAGWYWAVLVAFALPEALITIQAFRNFMCRKATTKNFDCSYTAIVIVMELLHVIGLAMLVFLVLPRLDSLVASIVTTAIIFVPSLMRTLYWRQKRSAPKREPEPDTCLAELKTRLRMVDVTVSLDLLAALIQLSIFVYLPIMILPYTQNDTRSNTISNSYIVFYAASISCILTSCMWWENFVSSKSAFPVLRQLHNLSLRNRERRIQIQLGLGPTKIILMGLLMVAFYWLNFASEKSLHDNMTDLGHGLLEFFQTSPTDAPLETDNEDSAASNTFALSLTSPRVQVHDFWIVLIVQFTSALVSTKVGVLACQTLMQGCAFSLPSTLASPALIITVGILTHVPDGPGSLQYYYKHGSGYPSFKIMDHFEAWTDVFTRSYFWIWICLYASQIWTTRHIWINRNTIRLAKPDSLFALPAYTGTFVDQHIMCSRRCKGPDVGTISSAAVNNKELPACVRQGSSAQQYPTKVYACITMWHETKNEMRKLIGSLVGLDEQQSKMSALKELSAPSQSEMLDGYGYDLECHVFFDDAFDDEALTAPELPETFPNAVHRAADCTCPLLTDDMEPSSSTNKSRSGQGFLDYLARSTLKVMVDTTQKDIPERICPVHGASRTKLEYLNSYVKQFWSLLLRTTDGNQSSSYLTTSQPNEVREVTVPYGACYIWTLKNRTQLYLHLKDTKKVKRRKRWSQVMYLHYIENIVIKDTEQKDVKSANCCHMQESFLKEQRAANTFVLALDGDMEFKPSSVQLLLDFMRKDADLGAVCGRIHPTGGGPVVWYQQFEYATSQWLQKTTEQVIGSVLCSPGCFSLYRADALLHHKDADLGAVCGRIHPTGGGPVVWYQQFEYATSQWLQKTTEQVIGSVLCSPGCFSLYRADALLHHKVIGKYSRKPEEAMECLKYDQGEDRWLCTLMLKAGYRIRYCALAFAKTNAPVSFDELFNQRRRWISSSTANLIDILQRSRKLVKRNGHISYLYILYQLLQLVSTALSPGMTVLMLDQSLSIAFCIGSTVALTLAVAPVLIFTAVCLKAPEKYQLLVAQVLSIAYAILMVAEVVGLSTQFTSPERFTSPTAVLVTLVLAIFLATAALHPRSFPCYFHGALYFFWIPAMYVLLPIYSLCSLDNLSWGTREDKVGSNDLSATGEPGVTPRGQGWECTLCSALRCTCCAPKSGPTAAEAISQTITAENVRSLREQNSQILTELKSLRARPLSPLTRSTMRDGAAFLQVPAEAASIPQVLRPLRDSVSLSRPTYSSLLQEQEMSYVDSILQQAQLHKLSPEMEDMWADLLRGRLRPDTPNLPSRSGLQLRSKLRELRDRAVLIFFAINGLIVALVYLLQNNTSLYVRVPWPWGDHAPAVIDVQDSRNKFALDLDETILADLTTTAAVLSAGVITAKTLNGSCGDTARRSFLKYDPATKSVQVEPIGVLFIFVYVSILIVQFICMLIHRIITFSHLLASTDYKTVIDEYKRKRLAREYCKRKSDHSKSEGRQPKNRAEMQSDCTDKSAAVQENETLIGTQSEGCEQLAKFSLPQERVLPVTYLTSNSCPAGIGDGYCPLRMFTSVKNEPDKEFGWTSVRPAEVVGLKDLEGNQRDHPRFHLENVNIQTWEAQQKQTGVIRKPLERQDKVKHTESGF